MVIAVIHSNLDHSGVVILYRKAIPRTSFRKKTYQDTFETGDKCGLNLLSSLDSVCIV
jgi:hypothetical protein